MMQVSVFMMGLREGTVDIGPAAPKPSTAVVAAMRPPINAEYLFYLFYSKQDCDSLVGDMEEHYGRILRKFGKRKADFWYWMQCFGGFETIVCAWIKRVAVKLMASLVAAVFTGKDTLATERLQRKRLV